MTTIRQYLNEVFNAYGEASRARDTFAPFRAEMVRTEDGMELMAECSDGEVVLTEADGTLSGIAMFLSGEFHAVEYAGYAAPNGWRFAA